MRSHGVVSIVAVAQLTKLDAMKSMGLRRPRVCNPSNLSIYLCLNFFRAASGRATYLSITYDAQAAGSLNYLSIKRVLSCHPYIVRKRTKRCSGRFLSARNHAI